MVKVEEERKCLSLTINEVAKYLMLLSTFSNDIFWICFHHLPDNIMVYEIFVSLFVCLIVSLFVSLFVCC